MFRLIRELIELQKITAEISMLAEQLYKKKLHQQAIFRNEMVKIRGSAQGLINMIESEEEINRQDALNCGPAPEPKRNIGSPSQWAMEEMEDEEWKS